MFFNSFEYIAFIFIMLVGVVLTNRKKSVSIRNMILLCGSYYFYAQFNPYFVILLILITVINYAAGQRIHTLHAKGLKGKWEVSIAIILSIGILCVFKYAYLFDESILLPVGLSFFTFQALTYTIDIYRNKIEAEKNLVNVALFISFFPTILSGPIERARNLIPQFKERGEINLEGIEDGVKQFIYGLFKKVVVADRLALYVDQMFLSPTNESGSTLALAAVFYSFQIYCDFSGYADMAIGSGKILGFKIMENFNLPYCAKTIKEFWRRWHISLTSWFTEYVYFSLGGNRVTQVRWIFNISAVFLLSGIWHGATYTFILWGALHAIYYLMEKYFGPKQPNVVYHAFIFILITFAWVFFRIEDSQTAAGVIYQICTDLISPISFGSSTFSTFITILLLMLFIVREYLSYRQILSKQTYLETVLLLLCICLLGVSNSSFVYFQF